MKRINYSFYVLIFSAIAVSSVIITIINKASPLFTSKILFLCQKYISNSMFEIPRSFPGVLSLIIGVILMRGFLSFLLQLFRTHLLLRKIFIKRVDIPRNLVRVITSLGLTNKVILVNDNNLFSFCCGIFSPHVVVTTTLVKSLTKKELEAVLLHEQSHLVSRDPIKIFIGKTFSSMFFFLPVFTELHKNSEAVNELLADQWAIKKQQKTTFLRGALKKILATPQLNFATISNASGPDYVEIRIHRLVNPGIKHKFRISMISVITTLLFIFSSLIFLQTPVNAFHIDTQSNSTYLLCSVDQSCSEQCHPYFWQSEKKSAYTEEPARDIPENPFLSEKKCEDDSYSSKINFKSFSTHRYYYSLIP